MIQTMGEMIVKATRNRLVAVARDLKSDDGDPNPEYDRALVELIATATFRDGEDYDDLYKQIEWEMKRP